MTALRLFVYGTLRAGLANASRLSAAVFERAARTERGYALYDLGPYPALVAEGDGVVVGEIYRVSQGRVAALDEFEGCPELYQRRDITLEDGTRAMAYVMSPHRVLGRRRIPSGDFAEHVARGGRTGRQGR